MCESLMFATATNYIFTIFSFFFLQPEKLNVYKNDSDISWDYTLGEFFTFLISSPCNQVSTDLVYNSLSQTQQNLQLVV